jgi:hypothetical protein
MKKGGLRGRCPGRDRKRIYNKRRDIYLTTRIYKVFSRRMTALDLYPSITA